MPFILLIEASWYALLISSEVAFEFLVDTKSITETVEVGTRNAMPFIFPFNEGIIFPIDFAAPVDVGIILDAAARALRRSLCVLSNIC